MVKKDEIIDIMGCETVDIGTNDIKISGTEIATQLVAVIPNAFASPFQRHHEMELKRDVVFRTFEYREKELEHRTLNRNKICDTIVELAKNKALDNEMFQTLMVAYVTPDV